jgi:hypothetical protein
MGEEDNVLVVLGEIDNELDGIDDLADKLSQPVVEAAIRTRVQAVRRRLQTASTLLGVGVRRESALSQFSPLDTSVNGSSEEYARTDDRLDAKPQTIAVTPPQATLVRTFTAENWQFFAFVFAVFLTFGCSLVEEIPETTAWQITLALKVLAFVGFAYLTLFNSSVENRLVRFLLAVKTEPR